MLSTKNSCTMIQFVLFLCLSINCVLSSNILYISPIPAPSHHIWNRAFALGLTRKGHNVTLIGSNQDKVNAVNYSYLYMEGVLESFDKPVHMLDMADNGPMDTITHFADFCLVACKAGLKSRGLQQLLEYPSNFKFDLIIIDATVGTCFYPLIHKFNYPPTIAVTAFLLPSYLSYNFGNHLYPSYVPWYGLAYTNEMTWIQRLWNCLFTFMESFIRNTQYKKLEYESGRKIFGEDTPPVEKLQNHISLLLANYDPVLNYPQILTPNIISVGGLHTRRGKEIPKDLENVLNDAKNGIILFSLGSNIRSDMLDKTTQKSLVQAFSKFSETVIWKFESDLDNLPKNVIVRKWLPQNDILGHPNVKLFIGHGGALSTQEAIYNGVPMICVPFFYDQHINARYIVNRNLGISLDFKKITTDYVLGKIREILDNPSYSANMKKVSTIYRDRSETPLEKAIFWAEFAIRQDGAQFLSPPVRDLPFYKVSGLDVATCLVLASLVIIFLLYKIIKFVKTVIDGGQKLKTN